MKKRNILLSAIIGIVAGFFIKQQLNRYQKVTPEKALKYAKELFKNVGPINGSWIYMKPEEIEKNGLLYNVYRGGITRLIDGVNKQYEFYIDINTGTLIESFELSL